MEEDPDKLKFMDLIEALKVTLDRAGFGPTSTVKVKGAMAVLNDEALRRIKSEAEERRVGSVRQISGSQEFIDSIPVPASEILENAPPEGDEGEGAGIREEVHKVLGEVL